MAKNVKKATAVAKSKAGNAKPKNASSAKKKASEKKSLAKASPAKKAKKAVPVKKVASRKVAPKKAAPKLTKKDSNNIKKHAPAKKAAKTGVKTAAKKKLATPKKHPAAKPSASKTAAKKQPAPSKKEVPDKKKVTSAKTAKEKSPAKEPVEKHLQDHQAELKKAVAKAKAKTKEESKKSEKPEKPFVMPKTNTEKARKYEPEFTKSVLDQSPAENTGPTLRYSDSELVEFRELITRKLESAKKELGYLQGLITRKDQLGGDESDNRYMTMEDGSLSMEREQLSQMASRQITFIDHLEKALMRIENKTYGICRVTGKLIDKARLRAVPHATLSIEAKMGIAK